MKIMARDQHQSDMLPILDQADKWLSYLIRQANIDALWTGVLLVLLALLSISMALIVLGFDNSTFSIVALLAMSSVYIALELQVYRVRRKRITRYLPWRKTISELRVLEISQGTIELEENSTLEMFLKLMDEVPAWVEETNSYRNSVAVSYGALAFLLSQFVIPQILFSIAPWIIPLTGILGFGIGLTTWFIVRRFRQAESRQRSNKVRLWRNSFLRRGEDLLKILEGENKPNNGGGALGEA